MKTVVTGGAGFIGSHIVERLLKEGHYVVVVDNFSSGREENLSFIHQNASFKKHYTLIRGDIRDYSICLKACEEVEVVFHQAALRSVPRSLDDPYEYNEVNINGTLNMLKASLEKGVKKFIFASSSSIYGETTKFPEKETEYPRLISPYALTKLAGEYYCRIFTENFGLTTVSLRYFNVYGPRQALDDEYAVVIPKFITCMLNDQPPPIHGTGEQSRDFTYIDNVVNANLLAAKAEGVAGKVFNVGSGQDYSILELVKVLNKIMEKNIEPIFTPPRKGDVFKTLADISSATHLLGYKPIINFPEGLRRTVEYFKNRVYSLKTD